MNKSQGTRRRFLAMHCGARYGGSLLRYPFVRAVIDTGSLEPQERIPSHGCRREPARHRAFPGLEKLRNGDLLVVS